MRKKVITIGSIAAILAIIATFSTLYGKAFSYLDSRVCRVVDDRLLSDARLDGIKRIEGDISEIKTILAIINHDNPDYIKAIELINDK